MIGGQSQVALENPVTGQLKCGGMVFVLAVKNFRYIKSVWLNPCY
jgi:hypothetical protein